MPLEKETQYHNYFIQITAYPKTAINNRRQQSKSEYKAHSKGPLFFILLRPRPRPKPFNSLK